MGLMDILSEASGKFSNWLGEGEAESQFDPGNVFTRAIHRVARAMPKEEASQPTLNLTSEGLLGAGNLQNLSQEEAIRRGLVTPGEKVAPLASTAAWASGGNPSGVPGPRYGFIRSGPSDVGIIDKALEGMDARIPGLKNFMLRSNYEFGMRPKIPMSEVKSTYYMSPERWNDIGGWNEQLLDTKSGAVIGSRFNSVEGHYNSPGPRQLLAEHEFGHGVNEALGEARNAGIPGIELTDAGKDFLTKHNYPQDKWMAELPALFLEGKPGLTEIVDPIAFEKWRQEKILKNPQLMNKPLHIIEPSVDKLQGPMRTREDQQLFDQGKILQNDLNKNEYSIKNQIEHRRNKLITEHENKAMAAANPSPTGPHPNDELAELLDSLGGSAEPARIKTNLSGLSEADRPWTEIYKPTETGGAKYSPKSYSKPNVYELAEQPSAIAASDPTDAAFNYALQRYTPMHTDTPVVKEAKRRQLQSFMDWWQRSDDTAKRDFMKALPKEAAPPPVERPGYNPQPSGQPFSDEPQFANERDRLKALHQKMRSQSGKLRGVR